MSTLGFRGAAEAAPCINRRRRPALAVPDGKLWRVYGPPGGQDMTEWFDFGKFRAGPRSPHSYRLHTARS